MPFKPETFDLESWPEAADAWAAARLLVDEGETLTMRLENPAKASYFVYILNMYRRAFEIQENNGKPWNRDIRITPQGHKVVLYLGESAFKIAVEDSEGDDTTLGNVIEKGFKA